MENPAVLLMDEFLTSGEDHKSSASIVQEFRTSGIPFSQSGRMGNTTGAAIFNASLHVSDGNSKIYDLQELRKHYEDVDEYPDFSQNQYIRAIFICLFITECFFGVLGNFLVCLTVYRNKSMHSPVNYYIVNLGICDFLVGAVVLPIKLFELTADANMNMLNDVWCTAVRYLETIVVFASVLTLVAICFERYNAVVYPVQSRINMTSLRIRRVLVAVWVIPGLVAAPNIHPATSISHFLYSEFGSFTRVTCLDSFSDEFRMYYFTALFVFMYCIPLGFIAVTCFSIARVLLKEIPIQPRRDPRAISLEQGRRKVAKMVLVVVLAFVVCWSPYFLVTMVSQLQTENFLQKGQYFFTMLVINLLAFTNSCVNPFVYFAMSARFRKGFLCIVRSWRHCSRRNRYSPENSRSSVRQTSHRTVNGILSLQSNTCRRNASFRRANGSSRRAGERGESLMLCASVIGGAGVNGNSHSSPRSPRNVDSLDSSIPVTPNKSTSGNIKVRPVYKHGRERRMSSSRTILLQINHCQSPSCCTHLVPLLGDEEVDERTNVPVDDDVFPWEESCNL